MKISNIQIIETESDFVEANFNSTHFIFRPQYLTIAEIPTTKSIQLIKEVIL